MNGRQEPASEDHRLWLFRFLSAAPRTEQEIRSRLAVRGAACNEADALIRECRKLQLLDDAVYACLYVEGHDSWGCDRIAYELSRRGVSRENIRFALEGKDEEASARDLAERWLADGLEARRIADRLRRRGFSGRTIRSVIEGKNGAISW